MSPLNGKPEPEVTIDSNLVHTLLSIQHPDLNHLPIREVETGWDNAMFRLGNHWVIRLPRREAAAQLIEHEQEWLPQLAQQLPISVPTPYRIGEPALGYPWKWSILPWLDGVAADQENPADNQAVRVVEFLRSLHRPAPANAPHNPFRSVPLRQRAASVDERIQRLEAKTNLITQSLKDCWHTALVAPINDQPRWIHGDLHPRNILVKDGAIAGIIDWGDMTSGDIATDLASLWMLFSDPQVRQHALRSYGTISEVTLQRARGWAIFFGVVLLDAGLINDPRHAAIGEKTLRRIANDC